MDNGGRLLQRTYRKQTAAALTVVQHFILKQALTNAVENAFGNRAHPQCPAPATRYTQSRCRTRTDTHCRSGGEACHATCLARPALLLRRQTPRCAAPQAAHLQAVTGTQYQQQKRVPLGILMGYLSVSASHSVIFQCL